MKKILLSTICVLATLLSAVADDTPRHRELGWDFELKQGVNIGGVSPFPIPREIRGVEAYSPRLNGTVEAVVTRWIGHRKEVGFSLGLKFEEKGMKTTARMKNQHTEIVSSEQSVTGNYTGKVSTTYSSTALTLPLMVNYKLGEKWKVRGGFFYSYLLSKSFTGFVHDGYLRVGSPVGEKLEFGDDNMGAYNFDDHLNPHNGGAQVGATWMAIRDFTINADLTWGMGTVFKSDFKGMGMNLYPIFLNLAFGYRF